MPFTVFNYFKTRAGVVRLVLLGTGFIAFLLAGIAIDKSHWIRSGTCNVWSCPRPWFAQAGISILVIIWIFTVAMFFGSFVLNLIYNSKFMKVDSIGHFISGIGFITAFGLFTTFAVMGLLFSKCDDKTFYYGNDVKDNDLKSKCNKFEAHRGEYFQPVLFFSAGALSFGSAILALALARITSKSDHEPLPGLDMTTGKLIQ